MTDQSKIDGFINLEKNLEATIHEGTIKLGYKESETIGIYYDDVLLKHLLNLDSEEKDIISKMNDFQEYIRNRFGDIIVTKEKNRYKLTVPAIGVKYIYEKNKNYTFLIDLIDAMSNRNTNLDTILKIFNKYSDEVICEKTENTEFDYVIFFKDKNIDPFKYCFSFNEMGSYYHRLTYFDYDRLRE